MGFKQISVFLENKAGRLAEVTRLLADNGIDILAMSIADTTDFGILRMVVSDWMLAKRVLADNNMTASCTDILAIAVPDKPGGLADALESINRSDVTIEYMYAFVGKETDEATVVLKVDDPESVRELLKSAGVKII